MATRMRLLEKMAKWLWLAWCRFRYPSMFKDDEKITGVMIDVEWEAARSRVMSGWFMLFYALVIGVCVVLAVESLP